jgi:hypothetical protein
MQNCYFCTTIKTITNYKILFYSTSNKRNLLIKINLMLVA